MRFAMSRFSYDLHLHSCLSPCGDEDMTPYNIAGMGKVLGLQMMALTDHNSCRNCPSFFAACRQYGIVPVAGMELTTAEDIHIVCLFHRLEDAMRFDQTIYQHIMKIENRPAVFGHQTLVDEMDNIVAEEPRLLISATDIPIEEAIAMVKAAGGICYPAHVDRSANGIIAILGDLPAYLGFSICEFHDVSQIDAYSRRYEGIKNCRILCSSDAHDLGSINEPNHILTFDAEGQCEEAIRSQLFCILSN
ncbi:MAG: PHP domain-containing protein [Clostridiales bacterium]|nr:PHP domain-containing protein [Clostridiales bacterium]